ncbi:MAG: hypothetical protein EA376_10900 [Phycisphaeraceae bacterium]|nr:MAG: hypothetical protein EA376_10900 [Phycisphaeraceae bacterium]
MGTRLTIRPPSDFVLRRDVCSYGYFLLAPNFWDPDRQSLTRIFDLDVGAAAVTLTQAPVKRGGPIAARADRALSRAEQGELRRQVGRMLRLDEDPAAFHRVDPRWKRSGRGRLFRSPTFFEDVVKTVTSCNVTWPGTMRMNRRLCEMINPAFPSPEQLARKRPAWLRSRCGVGYRDVRLVELGRLFASGEVEAAWFEDPDRSDEEVDTALRALPGVGPYASANIMQLLGRCSRIAMDTEAVRHGREALGMTGSTRAVERALQAHYEPFGEHKFRSYWFEMWTRYEEGRGPAWTWEPETTGATLTLPDKA